MPRKRRLPEVVECQVCGVRVGPEDRATLVMGTSARVSDDMILGWLCEGCIATIPGGRCVGETLPPEITEE
jgi:hypothetical protein